MFNLRPEDKDESQRTTRPQAKASREEKALLGKELPGPVWAGAPEHPQSQASTEEGRRKGNRGWESQGLVAEPQGAHRPEQWLSHFGLQSQVPLSFKMQTPRPHTTDSDSKVNGGVREHLLAI